MDWQTDVWRDEWKDRRTGKPTGCLTIIAGFRITCTRDKITCIQSLVCWWLSLTNPNVARKSVSVQTIEVNEISFSRMCLDLVLCDYFCLLILVHEDIYVSPSLFCFRLKVCLRLTEITVCRVQNIYLLLISFYYYFFFCRNCEWLSRSLFLRLSACVSLFLRAAACIWFHLCAGLYIYEFPPPPTG